MKMTVIGNRMALALVVFLVASTSLNTFAQGRGEGKGGGNIPRRGTQADGATGKKDGTGKQPRQRDRAPQLTQATEQQGKTLRACDQSCLRVQMETRSLIRATQQTGFNAAQAQTARAQLRGRLQVMNQDYDRLSQSLTDQQKTQLRERLRTLNRDRETLQTQVKSLDAEIDQPKPDAVRVRTQGQAVEKAAVQWHRQVRYLSDAMGVNLESQSN
jgi:hypothetical protein